MSLTIFHKGLILTAIPLIYQLVFTGVLLLDLQHGSDPEVASSRQSWLLLCGSLAAFLVTVVMALIFSRGISQRLDALNHNVQRLAAGQEPTPLIAGTDEISTLDAAFRDMAVDLLHSHDDLQRSAAQVRQLNEELERRVSQRTAELAEANRELTQKNQEVEMFVYSVSHDLRSPLVNLEGFSKELALCGDEMRQILSADEVPAEVRQRTLGLFDESIAESIYFIQTAVRRLSRIIDALLRLSRAGRVEYDWQNVDLNGVLERIVAALHNSIAERGAQVKVDALPAVWGDATAVEQVFANLLGNALHYLDPERRGQIEVGVVRQPAEDGEVTCMVKDNGLGIVEAHQHKVFQAFQRLHPDRAQGEGMGLTIVRRIVERHRGKIWMESKSGAGTIFYVTLPIARATADAADRFAAGEQEASVSNGRPGASTADGEPGALATGELEPSCHR